jgi:hypothetical protein
MIDNRKINIDDMIKCVEREISMRKRVYPNWVEKKRMSQEKADLEIRTMTAVLDQLKIDKTVQGFYD